MPLLSEQILGALKEHPQGLTIRDICIRVSGTRYAISQMLIALRELKKVHTDDHEDPFQRKWTPTENL